MINIEDLINTKRDIKILYKKQVCLIHYTKNSDTEETWHILHNFKRILDGGRPRDFYYYKHEYKHSYFLISITWLGTSLDVATPEILKESVLIHDKNIGEM